MTLPANFAAALPAMNAAASAQGTDYKALVLVYLAGGNDAHNTVIPVNGQYAGYAASRGFLALPNDASLKTLTGQVCKLNPNLPKLAALFNASKCAIVANLGTLAFPLDGAAWGSLYASPPPVPRPRQLFSHSDQQQQWQSGLPEDPAPLTGWGGRAMDLIAASFNPGQATPATVSVAGRNMFMEGYESGQYQVSPQGAALFAVQYGGVIKDFLQAFSNPPIGPNRIENEWRNVVDRAMTLGGTINTGIAGFSPVGFPTTPLGNQLAMVARMIRARAAFGHRRDIFYVSIGGFDTHTNQLATHPGLLIEVDNALDAFYQSTLTLGVGNTDMSQSITTFTGSDFGRCLIPNTSGSDHGWGGHHFVIGGSVLGGSVYHKDTAASITVTKNGFPDIAVGGPNDSTEGRLKPTTSVDEYSSTLLKWFGVPDAPKALMIPNLSRFSIPDLGFMVVAASDVTKPVLGQPAIADSARLFIDTPITEPNSPALNGVLGGVTLTGFAGKTATAVAVVGNALRVTLSAPAAVGDTGTIAFAAGMVRDSASNLSLAMAATAVTNNAVVTPVNQRFTTFDNGNIVETLTGPYSYGDSISGNAMAAGSNLKFPAGVAASLTYKCTLAGTAATLYLDLAFDTNATTMPFVAPPIAISSVGGNSYYSNPNTAATQIVAGSFLRIRRDAANTLYAEASADNVTWEIVKSIAGANVDYWPKLAMNPTTGGQWTFQSFSQTGMVAA